MKNLFIGIDFSKQTFDVSFFKKGNFSEVHYSQFENTSDGFDKLLKWITSRTDVEKDEWIFCGENTGLYSVELAHFLLKKNLFIWLENPMQIKRSSGIKREKTDKADSKDIALYAFRYQDKARLYELPEKAFKSLQMLFSFRERLTKNKVSLEVASKEIRRIYQRDSTARYVYEQSLSDISRIKKEIKNIEKKMLEIIESSSALKENYELVTSVKGIGMINATIILIYTQNFTCFSSSRQFSCYGGMAPFDSSSGTSLNKGPHVSYIANKLIKRLLTQAALAAILYDDELKNYYLRKIAEGKHKNVVINNVRNKLLHRIFAVVRSKQAYKENYVNPMSNIA